MALLDLSSLELHNVHMTSKGLRLRPGIRTIAYPDGGSEYVGGFSVECPSSTEVWHYLASQASNSRVTMNVVTEQYQSLFDFDCGIAPKNPIITSGIAQNQLMISSPNFNSTLYGYVSGGLIAAERRDSGQGATTSLDIPAGIVCGWGGRIVIAVQNVLLFSDPGALGLRSFVSQNNVPLSGTVFDLVVGEGGGLYIVTSAGLYSLGADAVSQGQIVYSMLNKNVGFETFGPRNACPTPLGVAILTHDGVGIPGKSPIPLTSYTGRRFLSRTVDVDADLRRVAEIFPYGNGVLVGFKGARPQCAIVDFATESVMWLYPSSGSLHPVGTLRSREGEPLIVLKDRIIQLFGTDDDGQAIPGTICGSIELDPGEDVRVKHIAVTTDAIGATIYARVAGGPQTEIVVPSFIETARANGPREIVIGTSEWDADTSYRGRQKRTVRIPVGARNTNPDFEIQILGPGKRLIEAQVDIIGDVRKRSDK